MYRSASHTQQFTIKIVTCTWICRPSCIAYTFLPRVLTTYAVGPTGLGSVQDTAPVVFYRAPCVATRRQRERIANNQIICSERRGGGGRTR